MTAKPRIFDVADHLKTDRQMALYLEACLEEQDPELVIAALGDIVRAKGLHDVAVRAGLSVDALGKVLNTKSAADFATVLRIVAALGLRLHAIPATVHGKTGAAALAQWSLEVGKRLHS
ncbi:putative addiction module antidote protein [Cupriavidus gilardii]|uniref:addiction module antidote protein n=1 Tax=Cupriavidus gilardii TaxID=82541 RepID=UPI001580E499|nr:addiction module antidote protein [Cupriavidus gilardii]MCT9073641.1 putative addiction module antidote protein [Cupriavidus gilardii]MCT9118400.1 putative addiction module antidote protein [Cupriavidus gilardii]QKS63441.1 putative addiction module antidote protein [Cupriavidus gilardii]